MNNTLTFSMTPSGADERRVAARIYMRTLEPWCRALIPLSVLVLIFFMMTLCDWVTNLSMWGVVGLMNALIVCFAFCLMP